MKKPKYTFLKSGFLWLTVFGYQENRNIIHLLASLQKFLRVLNIVKTAVGKNDSISIRDTQEILRKKLLCDHRCQIKMTLLIEY